VAINPPIKAPKIQRPEKLNASWVPNTANTPREKKPRARACRSVGDNVSQIPLSEIANVKFKDGPSMIRDINAQLVD
jgi:hypothetical protein